VTLQGQGQGQTADPGNEAPDTRGAPSPFSRAVFFLGAAALILLLVGTVAVQVGWAVKGGPVSQSCIDKGIIPYHPATSAGPPHGNKGALGVCHIVEGITSAWQQAVTLGSFLLGITATILGWSTYRSVLSRRQRHDLVTGAVLGGQAGALAALVWVFAHGTPEKFVLQFMNFNTLKGSDGWALINGIKYTLLIAFGGELGGIVIGLILSILMISKVRAVRAPAIVYINTFRGTPLLVQLSIGYYGVNLGLGLHLGSFFVGTVVLALNMGAYSAEVFRAGIQSIERGQMEAARSVGMSYLQAMRFAIVPQAVRRVIPPLMNEFVILIKDTSLVGVLGLTLGRFDLFGAAQQGYTDTFSATFFLMAALGYLIITLPLIAIVNAVERRLRSGLVTVTAAGF
jgi:His/Glu/Gln/Arg/opine family amino acid ABC transporter permease subunit